MRLKTKLAASAMAVGAAAAFFALPAAASNNIIVTYAGNGQAGFSGNPGPATSSMLKNPTGVVLDNAANVFFADTSNQRIRKVNSTNVISTMAGNGTAGFADGPALTAKFNFPSGIAVTSNGTLYVGDTGNNRVRKITPQGVVSTVAGNGMSGFDGDNKPATSAALNSPTGVALDSMGNLYIADTGNNIVREVLASNGKIITFAGQSPMMEGDNQGDNCGLSGNTGRATHAKLCGPTGLATSGSSVLISDTGNNEVRKVSGGTITAFAGTGHAGFSGDGGQATMAKVNTPLGVSYDPLGEVYIVDAGNHRVRQVDASGKITTFAGNGNSAFSGDGHECELAGMNPQGGVTSSDATNVFFSDTVNQRVRRCHKGGPPPALPEAKSIFLAGSAILLLGGGVALTYRARRRSSVTPVAA